MGLLLKTSSVTSNSKSGIPKTSSPLKSSVDILLSSQFYPMTGEPKFYRHVFLAQHYSFHNQRAHWSDDLFEVPVIYKQFRSFGFSGRKLWRWRLAILAMYSGLRMAGHGDAVNSSLGPKT